MRRRHVAIVELEVPVLPQRLAAAYLGIAEGTLENWRIAGRGPAYVQYASTPDTDGARGGAVLYRVAVLDAFIEAHERSATGKLTEKPPQRMGTDQPEEATAY